MCVYLRRTDLFQVNALLSSIGVRIIKDCSVLDSLTFSQAFANSSGSGGVGGPIIAVFDCMEESYDPSVTCYEAPNSVCYDDEQKREAPWGKFTSYMMNVTKEKPVKDGKLWMAQAHWQSSAYSISAGTLHRSRYDCGINMVIVSYNVVQYGAVGRIYSA